MVDPANGTAISGRDVIEKVLDSGVESTNIDEGHTKRSNDNIYSSSEYATGGSGTENDPYQDGIGAAFEAAAADNRWSARIEVDGNFELSETVNPPALGHIEMVGTGNFNWIRGPTDAPAFLFNNRVKSPFFSGFRAYHSGGQYPFFQFDVAGIGNGVEPWFEWIEFDQVWRAVQLDTDGSDAAYLTVKNCWLHYGSNTEPGSYYLYQNAANGGKLYSADITGNLIWLGPGETNDDRQGCAYFENAEGSIDFSNNILKDPTSLAALKVDNTRGVDQPDVQATDNIAQATGSSTSLHDERIFHFDSAGSIGIHGNTVRGNADSVLGFATINSGKRYSMTGNDVEQGASSGSKLSITFSNISQLDDMEDSGRDPANFAFSTWYTNDDPRPKLVTLTIKASADGTNPKVELYVSGNKSGGMRDEFRQPLNTSQVGSVSSVVPAGMSYKAEDFGDTASFDVDRWTEAKL